MRTLPPALEQFCEGKLPSIADEQDRWIMSALFVPSLQAMKVREVEDLARQPESKWREVFLGMSPAAAVSSIKATGILLPREVVAAVLDLLQASTKELADADEEVFKKDIASLQVGGRDRDRKVATRGCLGTINLSQARPSRQPSWGGAAHRRL